jgi:hypothetical protein
MAPKRVAGDETTMRRPAGAAEWWHKVIPGQSVEVKYSEDRVPHERLVGWTNGSGWMYIRSPDGDEWIEDVSGEHPETRPDSGCLLPDDGGPSRMRHKVYRFREYPSQEELMAIIQRGEEGARNDAGLSGGSRPLSYLDSQRVRRALPCIEETPELPVETPPVETALPLAIPIADRFWFLAEPAGARDMGAEVRPGPTHAWMEKGDIALIRLDVDGRAGWFRCACMKPADAVAYVEERKAELMQCLGPPPLPPPSRAPAIEEDARSVAKSVAKTEPEADEAQDARTLFVDWDSHGERIKEWRSVCSESFTHEFEPYPLEGQPTALYMAKGMLRNGGDPRRWLDNFARDRGIQSGERVMHELRTLTDAFYYMVLSTNTTSEDLWALRY